MQKMHTYFCSITRDSSLSIYLYWFFAFVLHCALVYAGHMQCKCCCRHRHRCSVTQYERRQQRFPCTWNNLVLNTVFVVISFLFVVLCSRTIDCGAFVVIDETFVVVVAIACWQHREKGRDRETKRVRLKSYANIAIFATKISRLDKENCPRKPTHTHADAGTHTVINRLHTHYYYI